MEARTSRERQCLIVTAHEHTVCFCADEDGALYVFDPLPATMRRVASTRVRHWLEQQYPNAGDTVYSGLLLRKVWSPY